jgi:hypothetical protein
VRGGSRRRVGEGEVRGMSIEEEFRPWFEKGLCARGPVSGEQGDCGGVAVLAQVYISC